MKTLWSTFLAVGVIAAASPLLAQDWGWNRAAGSNMQGNFGNVSPQSSNVAGNTTNTPDAINAPQQRYGDYGAAAFNNPGQTEGYGQLSNQNVTGPYSVGYGSYGDYSTGYSPSYGYTGGYGSYYGDGYSGYNPCPYGYTYVGPQQGGFGQYSMGYGGQSPMGYGGQGPMGYGGQSQQFPQGQFPQGQFSQDQSAQNQFSQGQFGQGQTGQFQQGQQFQPGQPSGQFAQGQQPSEFSGQYQAGFGPTSGQGMGQFSSMGPQAPVRVGERVQPAASNVPLMIGQQVVGFVPQGQVLSVWDVQGPWVGTATDVNGQEVRGWIHIDQLSPVSVAATHMR